MRKNVVLVMFIIVTFLVGSTAMFANSGDDYKVIKRAVDDKNAGEAAFLKITVENLKTKKQEVKVTIPLALVNALSDCVDIEELSKECKELKGKNIDFKKIMKILKDSGPMTLVEVEAEDEKVKVWLE